MDNRIQERLIRDIRSSIELAEDFRAIGKRGLAMLVRHIADSEPISFNDESGFPQFSDFCEGCVPVVAVRVFRSGDKDVLQFNNSCGNDSYGLEPDCWYNPDDFGEYRIEDVLSCIESKLQIQENS